MTQALVTLISLGSLVALAAMFVPFKPFGSRKVAALVFVLAVISVGMLAPKTNELEQPIAEGPTSLGVENAREEAESTASFNSEIEREKESVRNAVETLDWNAAQSRIRILVDSGWDADEFKAEIETRVLELVKPIAASDHQANLDGYMFLSYLRPASESYANKVNSYKSRIEAARRQAVSGLRRDEDRVEGITWFKHPNQPRYTNSRSTAYLYIGRKGENGLPWLRLKVQYTGSDWLFVDKVTAWYDGEKSPLVSGRFNRDNYTDIWEWIDVRPSANQIEILRSLANSDEAILRFEGTQYRRDATLSGGDKRAIREMLLAYQVMRD
tara:strand:- start:376 stop:1356 length:981 start_codon:yes stop_codon:yes gene_type:complete